MGLGVPPRTNAGGALTLVQFLSRDTRTSSAGCVLRGAAPSRPRTLTWGWAGTETAAENAQRRAADLGRGSGPRSAGMDHVQALGRYQPDPGPAAVQPTSPSRFPLVDGLRGGASLAV